MSDPTELQFIPQGVALLFYGVMGSLLALYLWLTIIWNVGGGYNEFNKKTGLMTIFRQGYPGKNRVIELSSPLEDVQAVRAEIKEGLNPKRELYVKVKQKRDIPLTRVGQPIALSELENQAAQLARFLGVPLEGL
jgi:DNA mismatch repair protein MutH